MKAYLTQDQIIRRERRRKLLLTGFLGGGLLAVSAGMLLRSSPDSAVAMAVDDPMSTQFIAAQVGDEAFRRQLESPRGDVIGSIKSFFGGSGDNTPAIIPESAMKRNDVFADPYASAVAANSLQPNGVVSPVNTDEVHTVLADNGMDENKLQLGVGRTTVVNTKSPFKRISVGQPDIADINTLGPTSMLVTAKKAGSTQLVIWNEADQSETVDVVVGVDLDALREQIKKSFPGASVEVDAVNGAIALRGKAPSVQVAEQIVAMASPFSDKVLNFLEISGGQQVMLQVKFLEMSRRASQELGINLGATFDDGNFNAAFSGPTAGSKLVNSALSTLTGSATCNSFALDYALSALKNNNLARVLAEPNVTVISGQEASLLAGGEFPVPVPQSGSGGGSTITIQYREFGVRLNVTPVVLGNGKIRLKVTPEVSDLDFSSPIVIENNNIPIINKRRVQSTVEMTDGQTFAIAGLMRNTVLASRSATPLLGDLPIIGTLFRSVRYQREETELVVLVTPSLVEPMNPDEVGYLPGEYWRHPNPAEFYLMGDFGSPDRTPRNPVDALPARFRGEYGFAPAAQTTSVER